MAFVTTALFLAALYLTHITAVVAACLLLAADGIARAIREFDAGSWRSRQAIDDRRRLGCGGGAAGAAADCQLPDGLPEYSRRSARHDGGVAQIFRRIFAATYLFSFTWWEFVALAPLLGALVIAAVAALRRITSGDLTWPVFFVLVLLLSLLNLKTGSASLSERLAPFSGIAIVMTIASRQPGAVLVRTLCLAALAGLIGQTADPLAGLQELGADAGK